METSNEVKQIADQAVGVVIAQNAAAERKAKKPTLGPVSVPWEVVFKAWADQRSARDVRKTWMQKSSTKSVKDQDEDEDNEDEESKEAVDEVVERIKRDPYLDQHAQRLLGCIVDAGMFIFIALMVIHRCLFTNSTSLDADLILAGSPPSTYHRLHQDTSIPSSPSPLRLPARYPQRTRYDWLSPLQPSGNRKDFGSPSFSKRSGLSHARRLSLRRHGYGMFQCSPSSQLYPNFVFSI